MRESEGKTSRMEKNGRYREREGHRENKGRIGEGARGSIINADGQMVITPSFYFQ